MPYADNQGLKIHYVTEGSGPPLVLHHGFTWSHRRWIGYGYADALKSSYRLIMMDARGHGQSSKPHDAQAYAPENQVKDVVAVLDDLGIDKAAFWGYSMGGRVAYAMAQYAPERLLALVIGAVHPYGRVLPAGDRLDGSDPRRFIDTMYRRTGSSLEALPPDAREELFANDFEALSISMGNWPTFENALPTVKVPTLVYIGDKDPMLEKVRTAAALIPGAELQVYPGHDHGSAFRESQLVLPKVKEFLARALPAR